MIDRRRVVAAAAATAVAAWPPLRAVEAAATEARASIFNTTETRHEGLAPFPKWTGTLEKYFDERKDRPGSCADISFNRCHYAEWYGVLDVLRDRDVDTQLKRVNQFMNEHRYIVDPINWGVLDYWASPGEFFRRHGDCEDYAIAKFLSLRVLEAPVDDMRVVILDDLNLRVGHAIVVAWRAGEALILDNQLSIVVEARRIHHYRAIYSVNESGWWRHRQLR
ncbi:MAG TPA: transglutaminase-like cysteine peptidase [Kiloniellales bacterium]